MKALILAAGYGSRLAPLTDSIPKSLVPVNGKPILFKQLENLYDNGITDITVVSGYRANMVEAAVHDSFRDVNIIESVDYRDTNNMYSAWLAREAMGDDDFLMMNADVFMDASVIEALLAFDAPNAIVTDIGFYLEESMKVIEDENGRLTHISKQIPPRRKSGTRRWTRRAPPPAASAWRCGSAGRSRPQSPSWPPRDRSRCR